jgi:hypothetical protein
MNILLLASHGIAEYDDVRMFARLGYDVFCPGGYSEPARPGETLRPGVPEAPDHPELRALCDAQREKHAGRDPGPLIDWAKAALHPDLIEWADVIIAHHFVDRWIAGQWGRIRHKRVIWRTCGQSDTTLEHYMAQFHREGLQIVRYSPAERRYFESVGAFAGEDAVIRFGKYPDDYGPWTGEDAVIGNITQHMVERGNATGLDFWLTATEGLPARPAGPGSELLPGGIGALSYDEMREYLRRCRAYLYTGTTPASYTLGLIEAMLSGVPVVSIGPDQWHGPAELFEGHEIVGSYRKGELQSWWWGEDVGIALRALLHEDSGRSEQMVKRATELFGMDTIGPQWQAFLGAPRVDRATPVGAWDLVL